MSKQKHLRVFGPPLLLLTKCLVIHFSTAELSMHPMILPQNRHPWVFISPSLSRKQDKLKTSNSTSSSHLGPWSIVPVHKSSRLSDGSLRFVRCAYAVPMLWYVTPTLFFRFRFSRRCRPSKQWQLPTAHKSHAILCFVYGLTWVYVFRCLLVSCCRIVLVLQYPRAAAWPLYRATTGLLWVQNRHQSMMATGCE